MLAAEAGDVSGRVFNIACGERITLSRLLDELRSLTGREVEAVYDSLRPGDVPHSLADISAAREALGYEPVVGLRQGLRQTVDWDEARAQSLPPD